MWRDYLIERRQELTRLRVFVNGKEINPTDILPVVITAHYSWLSDLEKRRSANGLYDKSYKDDVFIIQKGTKKSVARFRSLSMPVQLLGTKTTYSCVDIFPEFYTGAQRHSGSMWVTAR